MVSTIVPNTSSKLGMIYKYLLSEGSKAYFPVPTSSFIHGRNRATLHMPTKMMKLCNLG